MLDLHLCHKYWVLLKLIIIRKRRKRSSVEVRGLLPSLLLLLLFFFVVVVVVVVIIFFLSFFLFLSLSLSLSLVFFYFILVSTNKSNQASSWVARRSTTSGNWWAMLVASNRSCEMLYSSSRWRFGCISSFHVPAGSIMDIIGLWW